MTGAFQGDAFQSDTFEVGAATFTADAIVRVTQSGSLTVNAILKRTPSGSFVSDAVIIAAPAGFTVNAVLLAARSSTFTANAVLRKTQSTTFTANAVIRRGATASFTADAIRRVGRSGSLTANAIFEHRHFALDAVRKRTQTGTFTANAYFRTHSFTARAVIVVPDPSNLTIRIAGVDVTDDVLIKSATFTTNTNGRPGSFSFEVRDLEHVYQFVSGGRVTVDIYGSRMFDGYVHIATARFAFPVDYVIHPERTARIWRLEGPDINILFQKRACYDQSNPTAHLPTYPAGTSDRTVILDLVRDYLHLSGDDITTDGVTTVGSPNPDDEGYIVGIGQPWGIAMAAIAQLPGAVWGLTQDRDLFYEDVNTANAPWSLSDTPDNVTSFGYANFSWLDDGTKLVNDAQVWGAGTGSSNAAYGRTEDATSITSHGRWQLPDQWRDDIYRQASVDRIADSYVYGSPANLHGGKDPEVAVRCRVFKRGLRPGMKVRFVNDVFGLDRVFPIHRMTMTFVNRKDVIYDLELSQEIDQPLYFAEFAPYNLASYGGWRFRGQGINMLDTWPTPPEDTPGTCTPVICGITDTFTRTVSPMDWGTSDSGNLWFVHRITPFATAYVDGSAGVLQLLVPGGATTAGRIFADFNNGDNFVGTDIDVRFDLTLAGTPAIGNIQFRCDLRGLREVEGLNHILGFVLFPPTDVAPTGSLSINGGTGGAGSFLTGPSLVWTQTMHCHAAKAWDSVNNRTTLSVNVWNGSTEPAGWMVTDHPTGIGHRDELTFFEFFIFQNSGGFNHMTASIDNLDVFRDGVEFNRCTAVQFEDFNRVVASGLGVSTPSGYTWRALATAGGGTVAVDGSSAHLTATTKPGGPWPARFLRLDGRAPATFPFTSHIRFKTTHAGNSGINAGWPFTLDAPGESYSFDIAVRQGVLELEEFQNVSPFGDLTYRFGGDGLPVASPATNFSIVDDTWYQARMEFSAGQVRARAWLDSASEPAGWGTMPLLGDYRSDGTTGTTSGGTGMSLINGTNVGSVGMWVDYIEYDYADKPCYLVDTWGVIDDFTRTIAPISWDRTTPDSYGVWNIGSPTGSSTFYVNGTQGILVGGHATPLGSARGTTAVLSGTFPGGTYPWQDANFRVRVKFQLDVNGTGSPAILFDFGSSAYVDMFFQHGTDPGNQKIGISRSGNLGFPEYALSNITTGANYIFEMEYVQTAGIHRARIYLESDAAPNWQVSRDSSSDPSTVSSGMRIVSNPATGSPDVTYSIEEITYLIGESGVPPDPVPGIPLSPTAGSYGCETPVRVSSTEYATRYQYVAGSTEVHLDDFFLRPGIDYTEDPTAQTIFFTNAVDVSSHIYVCYRAIGTTASRASVLFD